MAELEVVIDGRPARRGANIVIRSLGDIERKTRGTEKGLNRTTRAMNRTARAGAGMGTALKAVGVLLVARKIVQYADAWTSLQNRLKLVTDGTEELAVVTEEVFQIAQRTRGGLVETADLYSRIARSSDNLGVSTKELLDVTESINQAIAISGSTTDSANAAIIQLGQGLAAGALRGQELMSVMEQTPRLARALADGLGIPIGQLKLLGEQGEITAEKVIKAIQDQADILNTEFGETSATVAQSFTILENSIIRAVGQFSDATGAAGGFSSVIIGLADFIEDDFTPGLLRFGDILGVTFQEVDRITDDAGSGFESLGIDIEKVADFVGDALLNIPLNMIRAFEVIQTEIAGGVAQVAADLALFANSAEGIFVGIFGDDEEARQVAMERIGLIEQEKLVGEELIAARIKIGDRMFAQEKQLKDAIEDRVNLQKNLDKVDTGGEGGESPISIAQLKSASKLLKSVQTDQEKFSMAIAEATALQAAGALVGDDYNKVIQRLSEEYSATLPEVKAYNDAIDEGAKLTEESQTPEEAHIARISRFGELLEMGAINWETYNRALKTSAETMQEADPVWLAQQERLERVAELMEEVKTPQEEFNERMMELNTLMESGDLSGEQFERLSVAAQTAFEEATLAADPFLQKLNQIAESAGQNIESAFSDFLVDPSKDAFDQMLQSFTDTIKKMLAEALAAQIMKALFGGTGAGAGADGGGGLGGLFAGFIGGGFGTAAEGGSFPAGSPVLVGEEGPEIITPNRPSTVIPNDESMSMMGGAPQVNVPVTVNNITDPSAIVSALESGSGEKAIMNMIANNPEAIRRVLN